MTDTLTQRTSIYKKLFLKNKKIVWGIGDSICDRTFARTAPGIPRIAFAKIVNEYTDSRAIGGSNIAKYIGVDDNIWNPLSIVERSKSSAVNYVEFANCDLLICWAGFNDKGDNVPIGAVDSVDEFTVSGAINVAITNFKSRNPAMNILWITPNLNLYSGVVANSEGLTLKDYRDGIVAVCEARDIEYYDLYNNSGITEANKATALPDEVHPSTEFLTTYATDIANYAISLGYL